MNLTIVLAQILGIIFTVLGLSFLTNTKGVSAFVHETTQNQGLLWLYGFVTLGIGAVLVALNNAWSSGTTQLIITVIGWLALLKGLLILVCPNFMTPLYRKYNKSGILLFGGLVSFVVGVLLLYKGF